MSRIGVAVSCVLLTEVACTGEQAPAALRAWPLSLIPEDAAPRVATTDIDGSGSSDEIVDWASMGSGGSLSLECYRDGESGHIACVRVDRTAYAKFFGILRYLDPELENQAEKFLPAPECRRPDEFDPAQSAMWLLLISPPVPPVRWFIGSPRSQEPVCLTPSEAQRLLGGQGWPPDSELPIEDYRVVYEPSSPEEGTFGSPANAVGRVLTTQKFAVHQQGSALAVFSVAADQHAWFLNLGAPAGSFKLDRWRRIASLRVESANVIAYKDAAEEFASGSATDTFVDLTRLLPSPTGQRP